MPASPHSRVPDPAPVEPSRIGVVVHPSRDIDEPLETLRAWAREHGAEIVQIPVPGQHRHVAEPGDAADCDLIVAIGGDGTMLAALRSGGPDGRPVLGVAFGSLGALAAVNVTDVSAALDRFIRGDWEARHLPGLEVKRPDGDDVFALNDVSIVRAGEGQVRTTAAVNGTLFARFAGDGCVVSTPIGSSAYSLAAGGPLVSPDVQAFLLTPLPNHGGFCPPLVVSHHAQLELEFVLGHGGARLELDGQVWDSDVAAMTITLHDAMATKVAFHDHEPFIARLRDRQIIIDSPRIVAEDARHRNTLIDRETRDD